MADKKICFVVMGFGKKTDYESRRTLDLDATYEAIIQPAVEDNGMRCIRANEILHSGVIDSKMYEMLLRSDLVIADISTGNVNAVYELGVRHALRPYSTIIMKEDKGGFHFDLDHINTFTYSHLGEDIGNREAKRATHDLKLLIKETMNNPAADSPVYTFIPTLKQPTLSDKKYEEMLAEAEETQAQFSQYLADAKKAVKASDHVAAAKAFEEALNFNPDNDYLIQQLALHRYKTKEPSVFLALTDAAAIITQLNPEQSSDPETLGISGAIYKGMWQVTGDKETLDRAIFFYERGYNLKQDYYNGENVAMCLEARCKIQENADEALYDRMAAEKIRRSISENLLEVIQEKDFDQRSDQKWIFATLANCFFALNDNKQAKQYEDSFYDLTEVDWERETYQQGKDSVLKLHTQSTKKSNK